MENPFGRGTTGSAWGFCHPTTFNSYPFKDTPNPQNAFKIAEKLPTQSQSGHQAPRQQSVRLLSVTTPQIFSHTETVINDDSVIDGGSELTEPGSLLLCVLTELGGEVILADDVEDELDEEDTVEVRLDVDEEEGVEEEVEDEGEGEVSVVEAGLYTADEAAVQPSAGLASVSCQLVSFSPR